MKKIAVVTATRAEYGLLSRIIQELRKRENSELKIDLIVTGTHLSERYGMTINEIKDRIDYKIPISVKSDTALNISENQAEVLIKFTRLFWKEKYNALMLLGDRYEALAIAIAAGNTKTPVFHLCGGDITEGAIDEWIRHSISKISYIHFVTNEESRKRVIQLGESPERVFNYGSTSIDNIHTVADMSKAEALKSVGLEECQYALCTYHPVTMGSEDVDVLVSEFLNAIRYFTKIKFIVTKSNADQGGAYINKQLDEAESRIPNLYVFSSLGIRRYLSLMKYSEFVLGNSSSGIIEAPAFHVPTVNIGERQKGRLRSESVIDCGYKTENIVEAVKKAVSDKHRNLCEKVISPYGDGHAAEKIAEKTISIVIENKINLAKKFYDLK